jgi:hypothetical protein
MATSTCRAPAGNAAPSIRPPIPICRRP